MGRPKLKENEKKIKVGITISNHSFNMLNELTSNKSELIDTLIKEYLNKITITIDTEVKYDEYNNFIGTKTTKIIETND
jgi:hypothetical protein